MEAFFQIRAGLRYWEKTFLWLPKLIDKRIHWLHTAYRSPEFVSGEYEYKTKKQYLIDILKDKK